MRHQNHLTHVSTRPGRDPVHGAFLQRTVLRSATIAALFLLAGSGRILAGSEAVMGWGDNYASQLCAAKNTVTEPVKVGSLSDVTAVSAGGMHSLALKADGTVLAWGAGGEGQLGNGKTELGESPQPIPLLVGITAVASGPRHSLALKSDGTALAWGGNADGQLGCGDTRNRPAPVTVGNLAGVKALAAGLKHSLALKSDGTVLAWGSNEHGQVGAGGAVGAGEGSPTPAAVKGLTEVVAIGAGEAHSLALRKDGTVWAWGWNGYGQLGTGGSGIDEESAVPVEVAGLKGVRAISAGGMHSLALKSDGTVWSWGCCTRGRVEDRNPHPSPVEVEGLTGIVAICAGDGHSLALKSDGTVWSWGGNESGQLGCGNRLASPKPVEVKGLAGVTAISAGGSHSLALVKAG